MVASRDLSDSAIVANMDLKKNDFKINSLKRRQSAFDCF